MNLSARPRRKRSSEALPWAHNDMAAVTRRSFLKKASGAAIGSFTASAANAGSQSRSASIALITHESDEIAGAVPSTWALGQLVALLEDAGVMVRRARRLEESGKSELCVVTGGAGSMLVEEILRQWARQLSITGRSR
jgi:hypothetical protein